MKNIVDRHLVTLGKASTLVQDVIKINQDANFNMHGWTSNDTRALSNISNSVNAKNKERASLCDRGGERVLGLFWDTDLDVLSFNVGFLRVKTKAKKQNLKYTAFY